MKVKIATNLVWPAFRNVALNIHKALKPYCDSSILDWKEVKPGGNILFIETVREDTLKFLKKFLLESNIVFYGTTEGHSFLNGESVELARKIKVVAVSNFVRQMLEEVGVSVSGVVHHGVDLEAKEADASFLRLVKEKLKGKLVTLTIASNDPRKGLDKLLQAYTIVEAEIPNSFLVLHSEPKRYYDREKKRYRERYYDLPEMVSKLRIERIWLTNSHGMMPSEEVKALYKLCHVYVLSSFSEGFGLPMLEAFRFNKPVIAVNAPPFNEVIEDGQTGKLIPCKEVQWFNHKNKILFKMHVYEPQDLAEAMSSLLLNNGLRKRMESRIQEKKNHWNIYNLYPKLLSYF
ncbi:MAG: glycosyltransferase family 4 protein [Candidatus Bathyarchaeota archaeon]